MSACWLAFYRQYRQIGMLLAALSGVLFARTRTNTSICKYIRYLLYILNMSVRMAEDYLTMQPITPWRADRACDRAFLNQISGRCPIQAIGAGSP